MNRDGDPALAQKQRRRKAPETRADDRDFQRHVPGLLTVTRLGRAVAGDGVADRIRRASPQPIQLAISG